MALFRRDAEKEFDKEKTFERVKGTLQCITVTEKWIWGCKKSGEVVLASVDDPADGHVWKGPGDSDDPTLVNGQKALRVATTEDWCVKHDFASFLIKLPSFWIRLRSFLQVLRDDEEGGDLSHSGRW